MIEFPINIQEKIEDLQKSVQMLLEDVRLLKSQLDDERSDRKQADSIIRSDIYNDNNNRNR